MDQVRKFYVRRKSERNQMNNVSNVSNRRKSRKWTFKGSTKENDKSLEEFIKKRECPIKYRRYGKKESVTETNSEKYREGIFETTRLINRSERKMLDVLIAKRAIEPYTKHKSEVKANIVNRYRNLVEIQNKKVANKERRVVSHTYNFIKTQMDIDNDIYRKDRVQLSHQSQQTSRSDSNKHRIQVEEKKSKKEKKEIGEQGRQLTSNRRTSYREKKSNGRKYPFNKTRGGGEESRLIENSNKKTNK
jgi:hypothetical protein